MELFHNNMSVCAQKVRLVLAEKDLSPVEHHMNLRNGDTHTPEYLRLNPKGVVPTLIDDGEVIVESTIICEYLEEKYPQNALLPALPAERARARQWTQLPDAGLHKACGIVSVAIAWRHQILAAGGAQLKSRTGSDPANRPYEDVVRNGVQSSYFADAFITYDRAVEQMSRVLGDSPWLGGNSYSLADAAMIPYVLRLEHLGQEWMFDGDRSPVTGWMKRCKARANYRAIEDYQDPGYVDLATRKGTEVKAELQAMAAARS